MKNGIKYILQRILGYQNYLFLFSKFKIKTLKKDKKEGDFFHFMSNISNEGIILDVGANIGIMAVHLAKEFPEKEIYAIEPMPDNLTILKKIITHFKLKNVHIIPNAVGQKEEIIEMVLPLNGKVKMQGLAHVVHDSIEEWNQGEKIKTKCVTLDSLFEDKKISGIKMDVENFEYFALKGGLNSIQKNKPVIYLELWENENRTKCFKFLESLNYKAYIVIKGELIPFNSNTHKHQNFIFKHSD